MKIFWSPKAIHDYEKILSYLQVEWNEEIMQQFYSRTMEVIKAIENNPNLFIESSKRKNVRKAVLTKHNSLFYVVRPRKKEIVLLTFWDNRKNPSHLKY